MTWYEFAAPVVTVALVVRFEAILIGPYWAWLELLSDLGEDAGSGRVRRGALLRRVGIPGVAGFVLVAVFPLVYSPLDGLAVGTGAASLLLWPILFAGAPGGVSSSRLLILYLSFVLTFACAAWFGGSIAAYAHSRGSVLDFLRENLYGIVLGGVLTAYATGLFARISTAASRDRRQ